MPVYKITYETQNTYTPPVLEATLEFLVLPENSNEQEVVETIVEVNPDENHYWSKNIYGFETLRCRLTNSTDKFQLKLITTVKREKTNPFEFTPMDLKKEHEILSSVDFSIDNHWFLALGVYTTLPNDFDYPLIEKSEGIFDFTKRVNHFVHDLLKYDSNITDPHRTSKETIDEKRGVCQDFAHLMLGILRKNNIPCRYVSGYLNQGDGILGDAAVHAWIQALIPGVGWIGFDPTNELLEDHHYIKIAHGVDLCDCATLKGVIKGAGTNQTDYQVLVEKQSKDSNQ